MRKIRVLVTVAAFTAALAVPTAATQAATLAYSNMTGGNFDTFFVWRVNGPAGVPCNSSGKARYIAASFIPMVTGTLARLQVAAQNYATGYGALAADAHFALVGGNGAGAPETTRPALEEWYDTPIPDPPGPITLHSKLHPTLKVGTTYWIVAMPGGYDDCVLWDSSLFVLPGPGDLSSTDGGHTWSPLPSNEGAGAPAFAVWVET
jgi:hypothetical protein